MKIGSPTARMMSSRRLNLPFGIKINLSFNIGSIVTIKSVAKNERWKPGSTKIVLGFKKKKNSIERKRARRAL
jgi:hypothetical protein